MLQTRTKLCLKALFIIITVTCFEHCKQEVALPRSYPDNGGLLLPKHFEALVVVDSIGNARHLAVNNNAGAVTSDDVKKVREANKK